MWANVASRAVTIASAAFRVIIIGVDFAIIIVFVRNVATRATVNFFDERQIATSTNVILAGF